MTTFVDTAYLDSKLGVLTYLDPAGTTLENPFVYDSAARDLKAMAASGLVKIEGEDVVRRPEGLLIRRIAFRRIR